MQTQARRILWIDDEISSLEKHILFLEQKGYQITPVMKGVDGLSQLKEKTYDAVLINHMMPDMDGIRLLSAIKRRCPYLPVVMVTENGQQEIMNEAIIHRVDDFLMKPLNPQQIASQLAFLLEYDAVTEDYTAQEYVIDFNKRSALKQHDVDWKRGLTFTPSSPSGICVWMNLTSPTAYANT